AHRSAASNALNMVSSGGGGARDGAPPAASDDLLRLLGQDARALLAGLAVGVFPNLDLPVDGKRVEQDVVTAVVVLERAADAVPVAPLPALDDVVRRPRLAAAASARLLLVLHFPSHAAHCGFANYQSRVRASGAPLCAGTKGSQNRTPKMKHQVAASNPPRRRRG